MGSLPDKKLSLFVSETIKRIYDITSFVETGTYKGITTSWASDNFKNVYTIDISQEYIEIAKNNLAQNNNVSFLHGDTRKELCKVIDKLSSNALFWLDAHKGGGYFGEGDDCPIINEILEIQKYEKKYCILIDDARAFMFPPQPPFDHKKWPDISTILRTLDLKEMRYNFIAEDVIVSLPFDKKDEIIEELHVLYPKFY